MATQYEMTSCLQSTGELDVFQLEEGDAAQHAPEGQRFPGRGFGSGTVTNKCLSSRQEEWRKVCSELYALALSPLFLQKSFCKATEPADSCVFTKSWTSDL